MDANGAIDLATPSEQAAQRKLQFNGFRVGARDFDERLDRFVRLLVQQEVKPAKIRLRQGARFVQ